MYMFFIILFVCIRKSNEFPSQEPVSLALLHLAKFEAQSAGDCISSFDHVKVSESNVRLGLVHIHSICSPLRAKTATLSEITLDRLRGDAFRNGYRKSKKVNGKIGSKKTTVKTPLASGISIGTLNYIVKAGIGTPEKQLLLVIDTASDVGWVQCVPCLDCYNQVHAYFDSSKSTSYVGLKCNSSACIKLPQQYRACSTNGGCIYGLQYGDSSITEGDFALETLTIGERRIERFAFGCGHENEGLFQGADGLLGLGKGQVSFLSQTVSTFNGRFAYCLPSPSSSSAGYIEFGQSRPLQNSSVTPLISRPGFPSFYFVNVQQITVGNRSFSINTTFTPVIDSGTIITRLPSSIYTAARDVFREATSSLPPASSPNPSFLDTCYDLSSFNNRTIAIPLLSFHLDNGVVFNVPPNGMLIQLHSTPGTFCFAFAQISDGSLSIIGNTQQQGLSFAFDLQDSTLSIQPDACS